MKNNITKNSIKKSENTGSIVVIIIFIFVIIIALICGIYVKNYAKSSVNISYISLDPIDSTVYSQNTSTNHSINLKLHLGGIEKDLKKINTDDVIYIITKELENLNYNDITQEDGMEYLKSQLLEALRKDYKGITKIYVENFTTDVEVREPISKPNTNTNNRLDYLKGLKWSK